MKGLKENSKGILINLIAEPMFDAIALDRKSNSASRDAAENEDNDTE